MNISGNMITASASDTVITPDSNLFYSSPAVSWYSTYSPPVKIHLTLEEANELRDALTKLPKLLAKIAPAVEVEFPSK